MLQSAFLMTGTTALDGAAKGGCIEAGADPSAHPAAHTRRSCHRGGMTEANGRADARHIPFIPKSTAEIFPGDYWGLPLRRGGWWACGRVLDVRPESRTSLVVALLDWCEATPPDSESIAGAPALEWAAAHVKTIAETGPHLLGHRPLQDDDGLPTLLGGKDLANDATWGYGHIADLAHRYFGRHFPSAEGVASERPPGIQSRT